MDPTENFIVKSIPDTITPLFDINQPWLTLDQWQKDYIDSDPNQDCFLLCGRQSGKTAGMSIKSVELCINHFKKGEYILICSITEKQGYHMLAKALSYATQIYYNHICTGKDKPTMHKIEFKNGTGILCYAAGETGEGLRGLTIKKLMIDEGSRMSEEFFIAVEPCLSITKGSMDIASTPFGKKHKDGTEKYFYKCSKNEKFKKFYVSAEDCPRHSKEFLEERKKNMTRLAYAQEYLAVFTDELKRIFDDDLIKEICVLKRQPYFGMKTYLGVDVAGFGKDECTFEVVEKLANKNIEHRENIIEKRNLTTDTTKRVLILDSIYNVKKIGIDDGGPGFGVWSELMDNNQTKRKTDALNNASKFIDADGEKSRKLLKEDMYLNLLSLMENKKIKLLDDDEVKASLSSIQWDEDKIFGSYSHVTEGIIRAVWEATNDKSLNMFVHSF